MVSFQKTYATLKLMDIPKKMHWEKLAVNCNDELRFIPFVDILYCKSSSNYTHIFRKDGSSHLCCKTLKDIALKLPEDQFVRIHHSYLVNLQYITALKKQAGELELNDSFILPVSRSYKTALFQLFES